MSDDSSCIQSAPSILPILHLSSIHSFVGWMLYWPRLTDSRLTPFFSNSAEIYILNISVSVMNRQSEIEWLARGWGASGRFPAGVLVLTTTSKSALWFRLCRNQWVKKANRTLMSAMKLSKEHSLSYTSPQFFTASNMPCPCIYAGSGQFVNLGLHSGEGIQFSDLIIHTHIYIYIYIHNTMQ